MREREQFFVGRKKDEKDADSFCQPTKLTSLFKSD